MEWGSALCGFFIFHWSHLPHPPLPLISLLSLALFPPCVITADDGLSSHSENSGIKLLFSITQSLHNVISLNIWNVEFFWIYGNCMTNGQTGHQFCKQTILPTLWHVLAYPSTPPEMIWYLGHLPYLHRSLYPLKSKICRKRSIFQTWQGRGLNSNFA